MERAVILALEGVTKQFAKTEAPAVREISLRLYQGDLLGLLGPSGCGKTTLLRMIAGFEQPTAGSIVLAENVVATPDRSLPPEKRTVGMVFQDYALFPHLSVAENVGFGLAKLALSVGQRKERIREAIDLVGLAGLEKRYPHQLSGGQQQRVALARALAPQPQLILLDEPLSNLDVQVRLRLRQEIRHILKQTGISGVFVTHDQEEALSMCDRVAVLRAGQLEQWGTPEEIYGQPATRFVAEFVTQANFLAAQWNGQQWETPIGHFVIAPSPVNSGLVNQTSQFKSDFDNANTAALGRGNLAIDDSSKQVRSRDRATLMIRQEDCNVMPDENGEFIVGDREFLGREHRYQIIHERTGEVLLARLSASDRLPHAHRVRLNIASHALRILE